MIPKKMTETIFSSRFSAKLIAGTLVINLFMAILVGFIIYQSRIQYDTHAEKMTQGLAHVLEESFRGLIQKVDVSMLAAGDEADRQFTKGGFDATAMNAFLAKRHERLPEIETMRVADEHGIVRFGPGVPKGAKVDISDRQHFIYQRDHREGRIFVGEAIFSRINKKWVLSVSRRLNHPDGSFAGVVYVLISLEKIKESFAHVETGAHGVVNLRDAGMNMIVRYPEPQNMESSIGKNTFSPPLKALLDAGKEIGTYKVYGVLDHMERTYSYRKVSGLPLYVTVGFAADDYLAEWRDYSIMLGVVLLLFVLLTLFSAWLIYQGEKRRNDAVMALQVLNRDFLTLLESATDFIYFKDKDSRIRFCSQTMADITGHQSWRDMVGKHDFEIFPAETAQIYYEEELPVFRDGKALLNKNNPYFDAEGRRRWVNSNKWPVFAADGKTVVGIFGISRDISELVWAQEALRLSEQRFRTTFEYAAVGIAQLNLEGKFVQVNEMFCRNIGYSQEELLTQGYSFLQLTHPDDIAEDMLQVKRLMSGEINQLTREKRYIRKDGEIMWGFLSLAVVRDEAGNPVSRIASVVNITELKKAEAKLVESEAHLRAIIESEPECIKIVDENGRLTQMNPAGLAMIEADSLEQVTGNPVLNVIAPEYREAFDEMHKRVIAGETMQLKFEVLGIKGGRRMLETHAVPMQDHGKTVHLAVTRDITERQKIEESLRRSNADLERFAYSVSHDMRQPLRAVSGHLQLLQRSLKDKLDAEEKENLGFALEGAKRMDSMIVSLLEYSRVGRKTEAKQWLSSREPLDEALGYLEPAMIQAKAEITVSGEWPRVFASRDELTRLFQNLIGNGLKYHEPEQPPRVEIASEVGKVWRVCVRDHGIGIDPKQIDRLFQFFSRLQARSRFEGTGMGLALCRRIVEHHAGTIRVESAGEGKGSTFVFELPLGKEVVHEQVNLTQ